MPRPRSLEPTALAAAALAVIDRDGLERLTMRAVATELRMSTMGLYRYVQDRAQLEILVVDLVMAGIDTSRPAGGGWQQQVAAMVRRVRDTLAGHPQVIPLTLRQRHRSVGILRWSETVLAILTDAGLTGPRRVVGLRALLSYVVGALQLEYLGPLSGPGTEAIAALPAEDFALMTQTARQARDVDPDAEFDGGLALLLHGIEAQLDGS